MHLMRTINVTCPWRLTSSEYFICLEKLWHTQTTTLKPEKAYLMKLCMHSTFIISPLFWLCIHEGCGRVDCIVCVVLISFACLLFFSSSICMIESSQRTSHYQKGLCSPMAVIHGSCIAASTSTASYSNRMTFMTFPRRQWGVCCLVDKSRGT